MKARMMIGALALLAAGLLMGGGCEPEYSEPYYIADVCVEGTFRCAGANIIEECSYDEWLPRSCTAICEAEGLVSNGCSAVDDLCECEMPVRQSCVDGTAVFCACREARGFPPCTIEQMDILYQGCYDYDPDYMHISCMALFLEGDQVDCSLAESVCLE